jgi:hypothetical protein
MECSTDNVEAAAADGLPPRQSSSVSDVSGGDCNLSPMPSRQATLSMGNISGCGTVPSSPVTSLHSAASSAAFAVGAYRFSYCPICFEPFAVENPAMVLPCGHVFHAQCHMAWRDRSATCAVCSATIDDANVRMMHSADLHARRGKGPVPTLPAAVMQQPNSVGCRTKVLVPSTVEGTALVLRPLQNAASGPIRPLPPRSTMAVMVAADDDNSSVDTFDQPRGSSGSGGRVDGLSAGVDEVLRTLKHAFSCFRCGSRGRSVSTSSLQRVQPPAATGGRPAPRSELTPLRSHRPRHEGSVLPSGRAGEAVPAPAASYEEQDRRMQRQKEASRSGGVS